MNIPSTVNSGPASHHSPNRPHGLPLLQPYIQPDPVNVSHSPPQRLSYSEVANHALGSLVAISRENDAACQQWYRDEAESLRQKYQSSINNQVEEHNERVGRLIREHIHEIKNLKEHQSQHVETLRKNQENEKEEALKLERQRTWCTEGKLRDVNEILQQVRYENEWITCSFDQKDRECNHSNAEVVHVREVLADSWHRRNVAIKAKAEIKKALADCEQKKEAAEEASRKFETDLTASKEAKAKADDKLKNLQSQVRALEDYEKQSDARIKQLQDDCKACKQDLDEYRTYKQDLDRLKVEHGNLRFQAETQKSRIKQLEGQLRTAETEKKALNAQKSTAEGNLVLEKRSAAELQKLAKHLQSQQSAKEQELADKVRALEEHKLAQETVLEESTAELVSEKQRTGRLQRKVKLLLSVVDKTTNRAVRNVRMLRVAARLYALASARETLELKDCSRRLAGIREMTGQRGVSERASAQPQAVNRHSSTQPLSPVSDGVLDLNMAGQQSMANGPGDVASASLEQCNNKPDDSTSLKIVSSSKLTVENFGPVEKTGTPSVEPIPKLEHSHQGSKDNGKDVAPLPRTPRQTTQAPSIEASPQLGQTGRSHDRGAQQTPPEARGLGVGIVTSREADPKLLPKLPAPGKSKSPPKNAPTGPRAVQNGKRKGEENAESNNNPNKKGRGEWDSYRPPGRRSDYEDARYDSRRSSVDRSYQEGSRHGSRRPSLVRYEVPNPFRQRRR